MIRPYAAADREQLLDVWYRASQIAHSFLPAEFFATERHEIVVSWLPMAETTVYEEGGRVVGFLSLVGNEVGAIFVDPDHWSSGVGRALMDGARVSRPFLELSVLEANEIGRRFYARYGFELVGRGTDEATGQPELRLRLGDPVRADDDETAAMRAGWRELLAAWEDATARAEALPHGGLHERVAGEWSYAETQRHLVFATDAWLRRPVLEEASPFWVAALPHSECPDDQVAPFGIDRTATPRWDEIVAVRSGRQVIVSEQLESLTSADLQRPCRPGFAPPDLGADSDTLTVGECLRVVLEEEEAHLGYALRDLAVLEKRHHGGTTDQP